MRLYTDGCVVDSGGGLMGLCKCDSLCTYDAWVAHLGQSFWALSLWDLPRVICFVQLSLPSPASLSPLAPIVHVLEPKYMVFDLLEDYLQLVCPS